MDLPLDMVSAAWMLCMNPFVNIKHLVLIDTKDRFYIFRIYWIKNMLMELHEWQNEYMYLKIEKKLL